jgi:hypothetical protein
LTRTGERDGAVEVVEGGAAVALAARDGGERVERLGLALRVAADVEQRGGVAQQAERGLELAAQARDLGAVEERARVRLRGRAGERLDEPDERREGAARDPLRAALGYQGGGAPELLGLEQVADGLLPPAARGEVVGEARVLGGHPGAPDLRAQPAAQEVAEERVQAVLLAARVRGHGQKHVAAHERGQQLRAARLRVEAGAVFGVDPLQQREARQKALRLLVLVGEHLLGEVVEDVALGLAQDFDEIGGMPFAPARPPAPHGLPLRHLPDELQRGDPAVRALAVLGELLGRQLEIEDLAEQLLRLVVGEEQLLAVDDGQRVVRAQARERERRDVARGDDDVEHVGEVREQAIDRAVDGRVRAEVVVVVQDEDDARIHGVQNLVQEHVGRPLGLRGELGGRLLEVGERGLAEAGDDLPEPVRDVAEEDGRVCVRAIELIPDELARLRADEVGDERGLA